MCTPTTNETRENDLGLTAEGAGCSCCSSSETDASDTQGETTAAGDVREQYLVEGMTCAHCVSSVSEELSAVEGVERVDVDLVVGGASRVVVVSSDPIPVEAVRAAVTEAGYDLVAAKS